MVARKLRGGDVKSELEFDAVKMHVNNMDISFAHQLFINGEFVNATSGKVLKSINPATEELICDVRIHYPTMICMIIRFRSRCKAQVKRTLIRQCKLPKKHSKMENGAK